MQDQERFSAFGFAWVQGWGGGDEPARARRARGSGKPGGTHNPPGVSPCRAFVPPDGPQDSRTRRFSGEVTLKTTGALNPPYTTEWSGCEAERIFRTNGTLECEIVYDVTGSRSGVVASIVRVARFGQHAYFGQQRALPLSE